MLQARHAAELMASKAAEALQASRAELAQAKAMMSARINNAKLLKQLQVIQQGQRQ